MTRASGLGLLSVLVATAAGCAGTVKHMNSVAYVDTTPSENEAVIIFLRASGMGYAVQSSVYELPESGSSRLVGIVAAKKKVAYRTTPGHHTFMVVGENADFMGADLLPGKVYFVVVQVRMGAWKARFGLYPVHGPERDQFRTWLGDAAWVEMSHESLTWAHDHATEIEEKRAAYWPKWMAKQPMDRPVLWQEDGL